MLLKPYLYFLRFGPAGRGRPYGPPPGRDFRGPPGGRGGDRFFPPPPPMPFDRYDPYYRYYMEREAYYARMGGPMGRDRMDGPPPPGDRFPPRDRMGADRFSDPRDRLPAPRSFMDDRAGPGADPYFRDRDPLGARPPPEYYER